MSERSSVSRLLGFLAPYRDRLALAIGLTLLASLAALAIPWFGRFALDEIVETRAAQTIDRAFLVLGSLWLVAAVLAYTRDLITQRVGHGVIADLRARLVEHALTLRASYFDHARLGDLTARLTLDSEQLRRTLSEDLVRGIGEAVMLAGGTLILFTIDWRLTAALSAAAFALPLAHRALGSRLRALNRAALDTGSSALARASEALSNVRLVKTFGREHHEASIAARAFAAVMESAYRASRFESLVWSGAYAVFGLVALGVVWYGVHRVSSGDLTLGAMVAYFYTLTLLAGPLASVAGVAARIQRARAAADRIWDVLDEPRERDDAATAELSVTHGEIRFVDIEFGYPDGRRVLNGFTLDVRAGETLALVGATGAGKSTVMALLQRFYDIDRGDILIDGVSIQEVTRRSLRASLAVVAQDPMLFGTSIRENIRYGRLDAPEAEVERAAQAAHVAEFTGRLEHGLDTLIGERGVRLSGGERQRIAIARALVRDAPILLLDEATSSLDAESESLVQDALRTLMAGRTTLVIAHRARTVEQASRIAVLDGGRVIALAPHAELAQTSERYQELFSSGAL